MKRLCFVFFICIIISGCSYFQLTEEAKSDIKYNDYFSAALKLSDALFDNPKYAPAIELIVKTYPKAIVQKENEINSARKSNEKFKWDIVVSCYEDIYDLYKEVKTLPEIIDKKTKNIITFEFNDYSDLFEDAKLNAAESHYNEGNKLLLATDDREKQKQAAKEFKKSLEYALFKDADELYERARKSGLCRMMIIYEDKSGIRFSGISPVDLINDRILNEVTNSKEAEEFLEIVDRSNLDKVIEEMKLQNSDDFDESKVVELGKLTGANELLLFKISGITYVEPKVVSFNYKDTTQIKTGEKIVGYYEDGSPKMEAVYQTINAVITKKTVKTSLKISGSYKIIEIKTTKVKQVKQVTESNEFEDSWGVYSGDDRALSYSSKSLVSKAEPIPPAKEEMISEVAEIIGNELGRYLINYSK